MLDSLRLALVSGAVVSALAWARADTSTADPFAFFESTVRVSAADRSRLDKGEVIARVLPADDGHLAFFSAARLNAPPDALVEWTRAIEELKRSPMVLAVGRFSADIGDSDLDALTLEASEVDALKRCRIGSCEVKLAAPEIAALQDALGNTGKDWREAAQREFRRILIARVRVHRDNGLSALPPYDDHGGRMSVGEAFSGVIARSPYLTRVFPEMVNALRTPRDAPAPADDAFYYWSRERYGAGKPVVTITFVRLLRSNGIAPQALAVSTPLYASHYIDGGVGVTAVVCDGTGLSCYLAYLNRTRVDLLGGLFGAFKRAIIEGRIKSDGPALMRGITRRIESRVRRSAGGES